MTSDTLLKTIISMWKAPKDTIQLDFNEYTSKWWWTVCWPSGCYCSDANDVVVKLGQTEWTSSADQNRLISSIKTSKLHKANIVIDGRHPEHKYFRDIVENHPCMTYIYIYSIFSIFYILYIFCKVSLNSNHYWNNKQHIHTISISNLCITFAFKMNFWMLCKDIHIYTYINIYQFFDIIFYKGTI